MKIGQGLLLVVGATIGFSGSFSNVAMASSPASIETREIDYKVDGAPFKGFLALPKGEGKVPGVLVVHEWWGHNEYARKRAKMLAKLGYAAFALDMYGGGKTTDNPKEAGELAAVANAHARERFEGAMKVLKAEPRVDQSKLAAIGYCFGGGVVLSMARAGEPLKAVVSFHGTMPDAMSITPGTVKADVLVLSGSADQFVSKAAVEEFQKSMEAAKANIKVVFYPGAMHGFSDIESTKKGIQHHIPVAYNKNADLKSWAEMKTLFKRDL